MTDFHKTTVLSNIAQAVEHLGYAIDEIKGNDRVFNHDNEILHLLQKAHGQLEHHGSGPDRPICKARPFMEMGK